MMNLLPRVWLKIVLGLLLAVGAILYCRHYWDDAPGVTLYVEAARCMLDRVPPQICDPFYTYPPIFALLTIPLVPLPLVLQNLAWYLLTIGSLIGCFILSARLARRLVPDDWSTRDLGWLYGIGLLLSLKFVFAATASQSYDALVVLLILAGLTGLAEDRSERPPVWTGVSLALAAALKATPLLFLPYLVFKRHYRTAAVMAVALVVISLLPDLLFTIGRGSNQGNFFLAWLHQVAQPALTEKLAGNPNAFWVASNPNNNSLRGLVGMFVSDGTPTFKTFLYPVYAIYSAIVALIIWRTGDNRVGTDHRRRLAAGQHVDVVSDVSESLCRVGAPIFAVVALWQGRSQYPQDRRIFLLAIFVLTNAAARDLVGVTVTAWAKDHRLLVIAVLLFPLFFAIQAFRRQRSIAQAEAPSAVTQHAA